MDETSGKPVHVHKGHPDVQHRAQHGSQTMRAIHITDCSRLQHPAGRVTFDDADGSICQASASLLLSNCQGCMAPSSMCPSSTFPKGMIWHSREIPVQMDTSISSGTAVLVGQIRCSHCHAMKPGYNSQHPPPVSATYVGILFCSWKPRGTTAPRYADDMGTGALGENDLVRSQVGSSQPSKRLL